jgi:hypothetical protein
MKNWKQFPILLTLEKVEMGATLDNITAIILNAMGKYGGLTNEAMASKWVCFGCNGDYVFQGIRIGVITQIREQTTPYLINAHCVAHQTNLVVLVLSKLSLVVCIGGMLQSLYTFFFHILKKVLEFVTLAKILETNGLKLLCNIKTHWISMLNPLKWLLIEYKSIVVKMYMHAPKSKLVQDNLDLLCDLELVQGLPCILPMLEVVHTLIKYVQRRGVFICEFLDIVKSTRVELYRLYVDPFCKYDDPIFNEFSIVHEQHSELLSFT